jgi:hypothetical protein
MTAIQILIIVGTLPFIVLGTIHNIYTAIDKKRSFRISPSDPAVRAAMEGSSLRLHPSTNVWRAWIGFNFSHGLGAIVFGLVFLTLALTDIELLVQSRTLMAIAATVPLIYLRLAFQYWFIIPLVGIAVGAAAMLGAFALAI